MDFFFVCLRTFFHFSQSKLGFFPPHTHPKKKRTWGSSGWAQIIEKIERRLSTWGHSFISKEVGSLSYKPLYQTSQPIISPYLTCQVMWLKWWKDFPRISWWGGSNASELHLVRWSDILIPLDQGGLGIHSMKDKNKAPLAKWVWQ